MEILQRETPKPGPDEVLVKVKAVACNPVDYFQRDHGFPPVQSYPAVFGSDVAGVIAARGSGASNDVPPIGARVTAMASSFYEKGNPNYGGFQEFVLVKSGSVASLPDGMSFEDAATLPMAVLVALSSWTVLGFPIETKYVQEDKQALLVWGGASSMGTMIIQVGKLMGYTVYTTASSKNHQYLKTLGADYVFDYNDTTVAQTIIDLVKDNGHAMVTAVAVVPDSLQPTLAVLGETRGVHRVKVAHPPPLSPDAPIPNWAEVKFVTRPAGETEGPVHMKKCFQVWLTNRLRDGEVIPSPKAQIVKGGMEGINTALDIVKQGVSAAKIVVPFSSD